MERITFAVLWVRGPCVWIETSGRVYRLSRRTGRAISLEAEREGRLETEPEPEMGREHLEFTSKKQTKRPFQPEWDGQHSVENSSKMHSGFGSRRSPAFWVWAVTIQNQSITGCWEMARRGGNETSCRPLRQRRVGMKLSRERLVGFSWKEKCQLRRD